MTRIRTLTYEPMRNSHCCIMLPSSRTPAGGYLLGGCLQNKVRMRVMGHSDVEYRV